MIYYLHIGGLVALGFDQSGRYLLAVSHDGRGLFEMGSWNRIARDRILAYPDEGVAVGIGPIEGEEVPIDEIDFESGMMAITSPDDRFTFFYESGTVTITETTSNKSLKTANSYEALDQ